MSFTSVILHVKIVLHALEHRKRFAIKLRTFLMLEYVREAAGGRFSVLYRNIFRFLYLIGFCISITY